MVLPRVCRRDDQGHLSCTKRPRPLIAGDGLPLRFLGRLASPDLVRIRTHKALSRPDRRRVISFVVCITCIMQGFGDANSPVTCVAKQLCGFWRTLLRNWRVSFGFAFDFCVNFRADHYDD